MNLVLLLKLKRQNMHFVLGYESQEKILGKYLVKQFSIKSIEIQASRDTKRKSDSINIGKWLQIDFPFVL